MDYNQPITEIIQRRYSCRTYVDTPLEEAKRQQLERFMSSLQNGPSGAPVRLQLLVATEEDRAALRGLHTYGFIRGATAFIIGVVGDGPRNMEDFGYCMEQVVLYATDLGLGTCWLGGTFNRSAFAAKAGLREGEQMPAVSAVGYIASKRGLVQRVIRGAARSDNRRPWTHLFYRERFGQAISTADAGAYATLLEMVRQAPSASNRQPWRIIQDGSVWHFYLQRTPGYRSARRLRVPDLQRVDMGIAMCHWELTAQETGLAGQWVIQEPPIARPDDLTEYIVSWVAGESAGK